PWARFGALWSTWWLGDATGDVLVGSVLLTLSSWKGVWNDLGRVAELAAVLAVTAAVSVLVFTMRSPLVPGHAPLEYTVFPVLMWAGLRFAHPGTALVCATVSAIAVWGTLHGSGPFSAVAGSSPNERIILLQIYGAVI